MATRSSINRFNYFSGEMMNHPFAAVDFNGQSLQSPSPFHIPSHFENAVTPWFDGGQAQTLEAAFARLNVNDGSNNYSGSGSAVGVGDGDLVCNGSLLYNTGARPVQVPVQVPFFESEQTNQIGNLIMDCGSNGFCTNRFLHDVRNRDVNGYQMINSSSHHQNGLLNDVGFKKYNSGLSMVELEQPEPSRCVTLWDLRGNFVALARDHYGCRMLQKTMKNMTNEGIDMIFVELIDHVCELMVDPFANYVVQKLIEICSEEQRTQILVMLTKINFQLVRICLDMHGTRAVQKLLECLTTPQQISLVTAALSTGAVPLAKDMNGHHVIQHCLKYFSDEDNKFLLYELANNCYGVATDKSGCCVLQHCVQYSKGEARECLVAEIIANALHLADDHYGNYVVQIILDLKVPQVTTNLLRQLEGHYAHLACNKYGSNVVEKCLKVSAERQSMRIIIELLSSPNVSMILQDPFGNYVMQSALAVSKRFPEQAFFVALRNLIRQNYSSMRNNIYGRKVIGWFEKNKQYI